MNIKDLQFVRALVFDNFTSALDSKEESWSFCPGQEACQKEEKDDCRECLMKAIADFGATSV
jgi:hypothetical protein